jgi:hypothetical protein
MANKYYYTSQDLIDSVKRRINIPDSQNMITDNEILLYANEEMELNLVPLILSKREDYFLISELFPLVEDKLEYPIPYRAIGNKLREVARSIEGDDVIAMNRVSIDEVTSSGTFSGGTYTYKFYIMNENICLMPKTTNLSGYLKVYYDIRPNSLVLPEKCAVVTGIDRTTGIITVSNIPEEFNLSQQYDFVKEKSPHRILSFDLTLTDINSGGLYVQMSPDEIPEGLDIGDHLCLAGETDVVNCPSEMHVYLAQSIATRILESVGDIENLKVANEKLQKMEYNSGAILDNRVDGSSIKAKPRNGFLSRRYSRRRLRNF